MKTQRCAACTGLQRLAAAFAYLCAVMLTGACEIHVDLVDSGVDAGTSDTVLNGTDGGVVPCGQGTFDDDGRPETACVTYATCKPGQYVSSAPTEHSDRICAACKSGSFSTKDNSEACVVWSNCAPGTFVSNTPSTTADRTCKACPAGTSTAGPDESGCLPAASCPAGTVKSDGDMLQCEPCNPGQYCAGGDSQSEPCAEGFWDHDGNPATTCVERTLCLPGQHVAIEGDANTDRQCSACKSGTVSSEFNSPDCQPYIECQPGEYVVVSGSTTNARRCAPCAAHSFSTTTNATNCKRHQDCQPGSYVLSEGDSLSDRVCESCDSGFFSNMLNASACTAWNNCRAGTRVVSEPSASADRTCEACGGRTTTDGDNWSACVAQDQCPAGMRQTAPAMDGLPPACEPCLPGSFCMGADKDPVACDADKWDHDKNPATACAPRKTCVSGQFVTSDGGAVTDRSCSLCPPGTFSTSANQRECTAWGDCAEGTYVGQAGTAAGDRLCRTCPEGMFSDSSNASTCRRHSDCAPGQMIASDGVPEHDRSCTGCSSGTFSTSSNAASCKTWTSCDPGTYVSNTPSAASDRACRTCLNGTSSDQANQSSCLPHGACQPGTVQTQAGNASNPPVCDACAAGSYCAGGLSPSVTCPAGTWDNDGNAATSCVAQTLCGSGQLVTAAGSNKQDRKCAVCESGSFSTSSNAASCVPWTSCDAGTYVSRFGDGKNDRVCAGCAADSWSSGNNASKCAPFSTCAAGTRVSKAGTPNSDRACSACDAGTFSSGANAGMCTGFRSCAAGSFVSAPGTDKNDRVCATCAPESFSTSTNADACTKWQSCGKGSRVLMQGSTTSDRSCAMCPDGSYTVADNALVCTTWHDCGAGTFVSMPPSKTNDRICSDCASGTYNPSSTNASTCTAWNACAAGSFASTAGSTTSNPVCSPCAQGTFTSTANESRCKAWSNCAPGSFVSAQGAATRDRQCQTCALGDYSNTSNAPSCAPWSSCPAGTYATSASNTSNRSCADCPDGTFSSASNASSCNAFTTCGADQEVRVPGTRSNDQQCGTPLPDWLWLDATDMSTITKNDSDLVTEWRDKSGHNLHAAVPNGSSAPHWRAGNGPAGSAEIEFNLSDMRLQTQAVPTQPEMTVFVVFSMSNPQPWGSIINQGNSTYFSIRQSPEANNALNWQIGNRNDAPIVPINVGAYQLLTAVQSNGIATMYYDATQPHSTAQANIATGNAVVTLGNAMSGTQSMGGTIVEIRAFDHALTEPQRGAVEAALRAKYLLGYHTCPEIHAANLAAQTGRYTIDPDGTNAGPPLTVTCNMQNGWTTVETDDFSQSIAGWSEGETTQCGALGTLLGGYDIFGMNASTSKTFILGGIPHTSLRVRLDYIKLDAWDGESAIIDIDDVQQFSESIQGSTGPSNECGAGDPELDIPIDLTIGHTANSVKVTATSTLDQSANEESFGIKNVRIMVK